MSTRLPLRMLNIGATLLIVTGLAAAQPDSDKETGKNQERKGKLQVGDPAPLFTLSDMAGKPTVSLAELQGKPVVLYFGSCT